MFHRFLLSTLLAIPAVRAWNVVLNNNCGFGRPTIVQNGEILAVGTTDAVAFITVTSLPAEITGILQIGDSNNLTDVYGTSIFAETTGSVTETEILISAPFTPFIQMSTDFFISCSGVGTICSSLFDCNTASVSCPGEANVGATFCSDTI
ncbi:hypothetical protein K438DRAFT_2020306 [Mycena galopus ATCC 62051]|nr:hypothetical protein K438DRAFT_2020306 [Mycena galopus ATCC 62051]